MKFKCANWDGSSDKIITFKGEKGDWKTWSDYTEGRFVKEVRVRMYETGTDYAGITGISLWMCPILGGENDAEEVEDCIKGDADEETGHE